MHNHNKSDVSTDDARSIHCFLNDPEHLTGSFLGLAEWDEAEWQMPLCVGVALELIGSMFALEAEIPTLPRRQLERIAISNVSLISDALMVLASEALTWCHTYPVLSDTDDGYNTVEAAKILRLSLIRARWGARLIQAPRLTSVPGAEPIDCCDGALMLADAIRQLSEALDT